MTCKVVRGPGLDGICVLDMRDGDLAEIVLWGEDQSVIDRLVQRSKDSLISIGRPYGKSWPGLFTGPHDRANWAGNRVRLLETGNSIVIEEE